MVQDHSHPNLKAKGNEGHTQKINSTKDTRGDLLFLRQKDTHGVQLIPKQVVIQLP